MNASIEHEQDDLIIRYLRGQLAGDDKTQFEIRMLEEPELLERVQLLEALEDGLRDDESALLANEDATTRNVLPFRSWIRQPLSLAASVFVAVLVVSTLLRTPDINQASFTSAPVRSLVLLDGSRNDSPTPVTGAGPYLLQIDAGLDAGADTFDIVIRSEASQQVVLEQDDLMADGNGWVRLLLAGLPDGDYTVAITGSGTQTRSYRVRFGG